MKSIVLSLMAVVLTSTAVSAHFERKDCTKIVEGFHVPCTREVVEKIGTKVDARAALVAFRKNGVLLFVKERLWRARRLGQITIASPVVPYQLFPLRGVRNKTLIRYEEDTQKFVVGRQISREAFPVLFSHAFAAIMFAVVISGLVGRDWWLRAAGLAVLVNCVVAGGTLWVTTEPILISIGIVLACVLACASVFFCMDRQVRRVDPDITMPLSFLEYVVSHAVILIAVIILCVTELGTFVSGTIWTPGVQQEFMRPASYVLFQFAGAIILLELTVAFLFSIWKARRKI